MVNWTFSETQKYLNSYYEIKKEILDLNDIIEKYSNALTGGISNYDDEKKIRKRDYRHKETQILELASLQREKKIKDNTALYIRSMILNYIYQLDEPDHMLLLYYRYIECRNWQAVAEKLNKATSYAKGVMRNKAIEHYMNILNANNAEMFPSIHDIE